MYWQTWNASRPTYQLRHRDSVKSLKQDVQQLLAFTIGQPGTQSPANPLVTQPAIAPQQTIATQPAIAPPQTIATQPAIGTGTHPWAGDVAKAVACAETVRAAVAAQLGDNLANRPPKKKGSHKSHAKRSGAPAVKASVALATAASLPFTKKVSFAPQRPPS